MVTKTREQKDSEHKTNTQNIRASYHERHEISHEKYHSQLNTENERYKAELAIYFSPEPPRDLEKEIDELKARIDNIKELRQ